VGGGREKVSEVEGSYSKLENPVRSLQGKTRPTSLEGIPRKHKGRKIETQYRNLDPEVGFTLCLCPAAQKKKKKMKRKEGESWSKLDWNLSLLEAEVSLPASQTINESREIHHPPRRSSAGRGEKGGWIPKAFLRRRKKPKEA